MHVERVRVVEVLRSRGLHERADWVDRVLPEVVDAHKNSSLLRMLRIDPTTMGEPEAREGCRHGV